MKNLTYLILLTMAVSCKPSVIPVVPFGCDCDSDTTVSIEAGDISQLQFGLTAVTGVTMISEGSFDASTGWTVGAGWAISGGGASYSTTPSTLSRTTDYVLTDGYYCVEVGVQAIGTGNTLQIKLGGTSMSIIDDAAFVAAQKLMLYGYVTVSNQLLEIIGTGTSTMSITYIKVVRMSELSYDVLDCESSDIITSRDYSDGDIEYIITGDIETQDEYLAAAPKIVIAPLVAGGTAVAASTGMITIDWLGQLGLDEGCYRICVKDNGLIGYEYIRNGNFASSDFWTIVNTGAGWSIGSGVASHVNLGGAGDDLIKHTLSQPLDPDLCYTVSFDTIAAGSWQLTFSYFLENGTQSSSTQSGTGNTTINFGLNGSADGYPVVAIGFTANNGVNALFDIDNVSLKPDPDCVLCSCESMCLEYRDSHDYTVADACNMLLKASNDNDALGFNFEDFSFEHQLRIFGKFRFAKYDYPDEEEYKFTDGVKELISTGYEKYKELQVYQMPEALHDILSLMIIHQNFTITIDGEERNFVKRPGSVAPIWTKVTGDAPVIIELAEKTQNRYNFLG